jgi:prepilin-type N-terminal cleavage/methylation domain-containing protein
MRRAFTLIEVLVVCAIVAMLLAVLMPALRQAREAGRGMVCLSNVRQLHLGATVYAVDHRDALPPGASDFIENLSRWHGTRAALQAPFEPSGGPLDGYVERDASYALRACPSFARTLSELRAVGAGFERAAGGYGYNNAFAGVMLKRVGPRASPSTFSVVSDRRGASLSFFTRPVDAVLFGDAAIAAGTLALPVVEYSFIEPRFRLDVSSQRMDPSIHFRHSTGFSLGGVASTVYLDGHARYATMSFSAHSGVYPANPQNHRIGWFGSVDDNSAFGDH